MPELLHRNSKGIIMIRDDFKKRSRVRVFFDGNGYQYHLKTYRFNRIPERFSSPYCSWANLDCCGGWDCDKEYLDTAVQEGKKLFAGRTVLLKTSYAPHWPTKEEAEEQFSSIKDTLPDGVTAGYDYNLQNEADIQYTFICRKGKIEDYFDIDEVFHFYGKLGLTFPQSVIEDVRRFCKYEISLFGSKDAPFLYYRILTDAELIATGLLLGYPIESTASLLCGY